MATGEPGQAESLFDEAEETAAQAAAPLAVRIRPRPLDEVIGQRHLTSAGTPFRKLIDNDAPMSLLLWGPPGTGKTTMAYVVSQVTKRRFVELSAVSAGVKDVRAAVDAARRTLGISGAQTVLFIDEVHRFSKTQQDALLPAVENRWVSFIGATTENPFFSVVSPLLSRSLLLTLQPLSDDDVREVISRALADPRGLGGAVMLDDEAADHLVRLAGGDARRAPPYPGGGALRPARGRPDRRTGPGARSGPGRGPLRPRRRPALRRDQRVHQVHAGQRRGRGATLPGPDDRGGGGPAVHRPAADRARQRGCRDGRPHRAADRRRCGPGGGVRRAARGADQPRPGRDPHFAGAQVQRGHQGHRGGRRGRPGRSSGRGARAPARRALSWGGQGRPR